jgi:DNA ligase-1
MDALPELYKVASDGRRIVTWNVEVSGSSYIVTTGYLKGKKQIFITEVTHVANSDTLEEQSRKEAESLWNLKSKDMYPSIVEARKAHAEKSLSLGGYKPMLAHLFDPTKKIKFSLSGALIQPKIDGFRITARKVDDEVMLYTRSGALHGTTPHINEQLSIIMNDGEIFDGELYNHDIDFEDITSLSRSTVNLKDTSDLQYYIYDFPRIGTLRELTPYKNRLDLFQSRFDDNLPPNLVATPTTVVNSLDDIKKFHLEVVDDGYEGAMLRDPMAPYENKRSHHLLKVKHYQDGEFEITGVNEGKGKLKGHAGSFTCKTSNDQLFDVKLAGDTENLIRYLEHPEEAVGRMLNVKFFSMTKKGVPRFPVGQYIRDVE